MARAFVDLPFHGQSALCFTLGVVEFSLTYLARYRDITEADCGDHEEEQDTKGNHQHATANGGGIVEAPVRSCSEGVESAERAKLKRFCGVLFMTVFTYGRATRGMAMALKIQKA